MDIVHQVMPKKKHFELTETFKLREYQKELGQPGVEGKNYILVAPTGTGKTLVAGYIIMHHLKRLFESGRPGKVVFITPTQQLTFQQKQKLQEYIPGITAVEITGAMGQPMNPLIRSIFVDVIVCTSGKLRQELRIKRVHITDFTLIIADECHHAGRNSHYADIMEHYIKEKMAKAGSNLPQVVGMTASPGAGKGRHPTLEKIKDHHLRLCAYLDATSGIKVVIDNAKELEQYQNDPISVLFVKDERNPADPFLQQLVATMQELIKILGGGPSLIEGSMRYMSWLEREKEAAENRTEDERERIYVLERLITYSQAIVTYQDFQQEDALAVLQGTKRIQNESELEDKLARIHRELMHRLATIPKEPNPLLKYMKSVLVKQYKENPESKGIFFVRAIKHTKYVSKWIQSCPELSNSIRVSPITGYSHGGMQKPEQIRVLEGFRNGTYNLLASTSVLEEGLDIPACNFVIRYQHVPNEIAQVQAKGRARAEDSRMYTVVSTRSNREFWYLVQEEKEKMAHEAIGCLEYDTLQQNMCRKQISFIEEREKARKMAEAFRETWPDSKNVELLCKLCKRVVCKGNDIFIYSTGADPNYVVPNKDFRKTYYKEVHDKTEAGEFTKPYRIFCNEKGCGNKWGVYGVWKETGFQFPVLKCDQFLFKYNDETQPRTFRNWGKVWFKVKDIRDNIEYENDTAEDIAI